MTLATTTETERVSSRLQPRLDNPLPTLIAERFSAHAIVRDGCWGWNAAKSPLGYALMAIPRPLRPTWKLSRFAHRVSYTLFKGEIPQGMVVMHRCDNPECTNPEHLEVGTQQDNIRDAADKGRLRGLFEAKDVCKHGHVFDGANTYLDHRGHRGCRECHRIKRRRQRAARRNDASRR